MIGELSFLHGDEWYPAYRLDAAGNLIRCAAHGVADSLIPFAVELVSPASELAGPKPWTITLEAVTERLRFAAQANPGVLAAYPELALAQGEYPFVAHVIAADEDLTIMEAIDMYPGIQGDEASTVKALLAENGVFPIPAVSRFCDTIHEVAGAGICVPPIREVAAGWMSSTRVYRKALVQSA